MLAAGLLVPLAARAEPVTRTLFLLRVQTGEELRLAYLQGDRWLPGAYERICWILRDVQANEVAPIDYRLVAILAWAQWLLQRYGYTGPIHVLSGYRSIETNLRTEGAAKNSMHLRGAAVDIRAPAIPSTLMGRFFATLASGGVGVYRSKEFVHLDTGPVRIWNR